MARIGLLGCGRIARLAHLPALTRTRGVEVVALADSNGDCLAQAGRMASGATCFDNWQAALAAPGLDAVVVTLPPALHAPAAVAAFGAGLHVYVEKPLGMNLDEAEAVLAAERGAGRVGQMGLNFRHNPLFEAMRRRLAAGELGAPVAVSTHFTSTRRVLPAWKRTRSAGGGVLRDLGIHHLDLVEHILGEPLAALAATERSMDVEGDVALIAARSDSGVAVSMTLSLASGMSRNRVEVLGTAGHLVADTADASSRPVETSVEYGRAARLKAALGALTPGRLLRAPGAEPSFAAALARFVEVVEGRAAPSPTLAEGRRALALVLAAEAAASSGTWVDVEG